jgi:Fe-S-cluster-containing dehydrogenase component
VFTAPADIDVAGMVASAARSVYLGEGDETAAAAKMWIPRAHTLESWGDAVSWSGHYSVVQPMIAPLFGGRTELEVLATIAGLEQRDPYHIVRETASRLLGTGAAFETAWRRLVQNGVHLTPASRSRSAERVRYDAIVPALVEWGAQAGADADKVDLVFSACPKVWDGRHANNGWLQELPDPVTKVSWDNPALISKATAERLGLKTSRKLEGPLYNMVQMVKITVEGGRSLEIPIWIQPGMPDNVIALKLGYGRTVCGRVGLGTGFNSNALRLRDAMRTGKVESIAPVRGAKPYMIANTQDHWSMEGRDIIREVDLVQWQKFGDVDFSKNHDGSYSKDAYGNKRTGANFASQLGMESHTPINRDVYSEPGKRGARRPFFAVGADGKPVVDEHGRPIGRLNSQGKPFQQWGMTIDLTKCTGCGACTVACQAENNIPIVGKIEVAKGREMHWIRVDRYYASDKMDDAAFANPDMVVQPVACVHCESAPCEVVCPVNATVHSDEGLNVMAYNRCIGTRYCSNNCPYKVRRFNYFDYATKAYKGGFGQMGEPLPNTLLPTNQHLVPPRLREPVEEVRTMQFNPHVTVRSRGVMEKCTFCIQRINAARIETKLSDLDYVPDGFFQTACQQACPADAIVFGDIYDYVSNDGAGSKVYQLQHSSRGYALLAYLNTRPRTLHLLRVRNPNPALVDAHRKAGWDHPPGHHGDHHDDHHGGHHSDKKHAQKAPGHLMSLPVLGAEHAAMGSAAASAGSAGSVVSSMAQGLTQGVLS